MTPSITFDTITVFYCYHTIFHFLAFITFRFAALPELVPDVIGQEARGSFRIDFQILLFLRQRLAPPCLSDLLSLHTPSRSLRSAEQVLLAVPRSRLKHRAARKLWNKLPLHIGAFIP